jgi:GH25 family lysozyme M1 (1,4-beta-N-acetylmuramidase)
VAAANDYVAVKCTGGLSYVNPLYQQQIAGARSVGLLLIHYAYAHESSVDGTGPREPEAEAEHFLANVDIQPGELVALDIEDTAIAGDLSWWAARWLRYVEIETKCVPLIYSFPNYIETRNLGVKELADYPLWYAYYRTPEKDNPWPPVPGQWTEIAIWQWSGSSRVAGIPNDTDQNVSRLTLEQLRAFGKPDQVQPQKPPVVTDPGFPGIVQPDRSLVINGQTVPDGWADRAERLLLQVLNTETNTQYWVEWVGHQWLPWHEGGLPL